MKITHVSDFRFGCKILLHRGDVISSEPQLKNYWTNFRFENYMKWQWYFRYRCALLQVQHPKKYDEIRKRLTDRQRSAKAKVTEFTNKIELAKKQWNKLFPIEEDDLYKRAMARIEEKSQQIIELQNQIDAL